MSESIDIMVKVDDQVTSSMRQIQGTIDDSVKNIKSIGGRAKASTELVASLSNALGGTQFGAFAGQLGQLTEKVSQFSEISKAGGAGAMVFKAGLVAAAGAIGFSVGKVLADLVWDTEKVNARLKETADRATEIARRAEQIRAKGQALATTELDLIRDPIERDKAKLAMLKQLEKEVEGAQRNVTAAQRQVDADAKWQWQFGERAARSELNKGLLKEAKEKLAAHQSERDALREVLSERNKNNEAIKTENAIKDKSDEFIKSLKSEVEMLRATKEERLKLVAAKSAHGEAVPEAARLLEDRDALIEKNAAETKANELLTSSIQRLDEEKIKLDQGAEAARAFALAKQGLSKADAEMIAKREKENADKQIFENEKKRIEELKTAELNRLKEQEIAATQGAEAADVFRLKLQGLADKDAKDIARRRAELARLNKVDVVDKPDKVIGVRPLQATESRLLTRGPNTDRYMYELTRLAQRAERQRDATNKKLDENNKKKKPLDVHLIGFT